MSLDNQIGKQTAVLLQISNELATIRQLLEQALAKKAEVANVSRETLHLKPKEQQGAGQRQITKRD